MLVTVMLVLGIVYVVVGVLLLVAPKVFVGLDKFLNTKIFDGQIAFRHKLIVSSFLVLTGVLMLYVFYRLSFLIVW